MRGIALLRGEKNRARNGGRLGRKCLRHKGRITGRVVRRGLGRRHRARARVGRGAVQVWISVRCRFLRCVGWRCLRAGAWGIRGGSDTRGRARIGRLAGERPLRESAEICLRRDDCGSSGTGRVRQVRVGSSAARSAGRHLEDEQACSQGRERGRPRTMPLHVFT